MDFIKSKRKSGISNSYPVTPTSTPIVRSKCLTRSASRRACRCRFYRNGDKFYPGYTIPVSIERYGNLENLYRELTDFLGCPTLPSGVRKIYDISGNEITDLSQICQGGNFVAAGNETFRDCSYLSITSRSSPVKKQRARALFKSESFTTPPRSDQGLRSADFIRARNIIVLAHGNRPRKVVRILLNKKTVHSVEGVLDMISESIGFAVKKLVSVPNGLAIHRLEDLFDSYYIFIALRHAKGKISPDDFQWPKNVSNRLLIGERLGDGHFAEVRLAVDQGSSEEVAVKIIDKDKLRGRNLTDSEISIMKRLSHPNIVKFIDEIHSPKNIFIILELVRGGDLFDTIAETTFYDESQACLFSHNLAAALEYLHSLHIVHRDIKPENLLVFRAKDGSKRLKLCDFGLASERKNSEKLNFICGTATYVAPEMIRGTGYDEGIDIWALGVISYILLCGFPPFRSESGEQDELFQDILSGELEFPSPYWDEVSPQAQDIIIQILDRDENSRVSAADVLRHKWLNQPNNNPLRELKLSQTKSFVQVPGTESMPRQG